MVKILTFSLLWILPLSSQNDFISAEKCARCHQEIYDEWATSMHAQATSLKDPLFNGMYQWAIQETGGELESKCIVCHSPMSTVFQKISMEEVYNQEGVTCQYCHGTAHIRGFQSAKNMEVNLDTIYSYHPESDNSPHPVANREFFNNSEICLPCHAVMKNPKDVEVCATGSEWRIFNQKTGKICQDCHMPKLSGSFSHRFTGTHQSSLLINSVEMDLAFDEKTREVKITLTNASAGHAIPTGTPLRMVMLKLVAYDSVGNLLWQNWETNPIQEDKQALFMKIMGDAEGKAPVPPWRATQTMFERRLMPGDPYSISYQLTSEAIYDVEASLWYRFAPTFILAKLKIEEPHFIRPRLMVQKGMKIVH